MSLDGDVRLKFLSAPYKDLDPKNESNLRRVYLGYDIEFTVESVGFKNHKLFNIGDDFIIPYSNKHLEFILLEVMHPLNGEQYKFRIAWRQ